MTVGRRGRPKRPATAATAGASHDGPPQRSRPCRSTCARFCDWVYDPEIGDPDNGVAPGTAFDDLPDDWVCPDCGAGVDMFEPLDED